MGAKDARLACDSRLAGSSLSVASSCVVGCFPYSAPRHAHKLNRWTGGSGQSGSVGRKKASERSCPLPASRPSGLSLGGSSRGGREWVAPHWPFVRPARPERATPRYCSLGPGGSRMANIDRYSQYGPKQTKSIDLDLKNSQIVIRSLELFSVLRGREKF